MKGFLLFGVLLSANCMAADWFECQMAGVIGNLTHGSPGFQDQRHVFTSSWNTPTLPPSLAPGVWHTIDVTGRVPLGARCVGVNVLMIITYGMTANQACDLYLSFRRDPSQSEASNTMYTIERQKGGVRQNSTIAVPLYTEGANVSFQFRADILNSIPPQPSGYYSTMWPTGCSFGATGYLNWFGF